MSSIELVFIEGNDFSWSSWRDRDEAINEIRSILLVVEAGRLPDRLTLSVIFGPTGPMQELSVSSGWGETFLKLAERFDYAEQKIWSRD